MRNPKKFADKASKKAHLTQLKQKLQDIKQQRAAAVKLARTAEKAYQHALAAAGKLGRSLDDVSALYDAAQGIDVATPVVRPTAKTVVRRIVAQAPAAVM